MDGGEGREERPTEEAMVATAGTCTCIPSAQGTLEGTSLSTGRILDYEIVRELIHRSGHEAQHGHRMVVPIDGSTEGT